MYSVEKVLERFQFFFDKSKNPDSNIVKLMRIFSDQLQDISDTQQTTLEWRNIDRAKGQALDLIGETVNQARGTATDEVYRLLLKSKLARSLSDGGINTIIRVLAIALDAPYEEIKVQEKWNDELDPEPAAISLIEIPIVRLNEIGLDGIQFARIVQRTVAAGVKVNVIELKGTFQLGGLPMINNIERGLSDVEGTIGGYLGAVFVPAEDQDLPI